MRGEQSPELVMTASIGPDVYLDSHTSFRLAANLWFHLLTWRAACQMNDARMLTHSPNSARGAPSVANLCFHRGQLMG